MRISRPHLASSWFPFYSDSPAFSAHSTAAITSLQGSSPLPGYPKTLRDLSNPTDLLSLPASFGSIQLGETFSSCLSVNNEVSVSIDAVFLRVEIQTATSKILLSEVGGPDHSVLPGDSLECFVTYEIKELGQHVLVCTTSYRLHPSLRPSSSTGDTVQTFNKFYKFAVTNPLSVKTKVHTTVSPSALLSASERDRVFLEVHIQNLTQSSMYFEKLQFECMDGWTVDDPNTIIVDNKPQSIFIGPTSLMQPQDIRQYIYILTPNPLPLIPVVHPPGAVIPLGRLDISWRSSFGEPGRLLTSMLSRRIPLVSPPTQNPVAALPPHFKRTISGTPSRPQSPQLNYPHPKSPSLHRPSILTSSHSQSPSQNLSAEDFDVHLVVRDAIQQPIRVDVPFTIPFNLILSAPIVSDPKQSRIISLAVQHLQAPAVTVPASLTTISSREAISSHVTSGYSTPSSTVAVPFDYTLAHQRLLAAASSKHNSPIRSTRDRQRPPPSGDEPVMLPPPYLNRTDKSTPRTNAVTFIGSSVLFLPPIEISSGSQINDKRTTTVHGFELSYLPLRKGFITVGGLRILLIDDSFIGSVPFSHDISNPVKQNALILKEWDIVYEAWVTP